MKITIKIERAKKKFIKTNCFHCGEEFYIYFDQVRATNFCSNCK